MNQDLIRHINAARSNCNIVALLKFCTTAKRLPERRHKALWPAVYKLIMHAAYMHETNSDVYKRLNDKFYTALREEYDLACARASYLHIIPKDLGNYINLLLTRREKRVGEIMLPTLLGITVDNLAIPTTSSYKLYSFRYAGWVEISDNRRTCKICSPAIGCARSFHRCQNMSYEDFKRSFPHLHHGIEIWNSLPVVDCS